MSEWAAVGVIVTLSGLFLAVYTPLAQKNRRLAEERLETERRFSAEREEREERVQELRQRQNGLLVENTEAITRLNASVDFFARSLSEMKAENAEGHRRIWQKNEEQDAAIADHGTRIALLEREGKTTCRP